MPIPKLSLPDRLPQLFMQIIGAENCPGVPLASTAELLDTLVKLIGREIQVEEAKKGLTNVYTIGGTTAKAIQFLFGAAMRSGAYANLKLLLEADPNSALKLLTKHERSAFAPKASPVPGDLTNLPLESAPQWAISWTNYAGVYERATPPAPEEVLNGFCATLDPADPAAASRSFWPTIASYGLGYNLLILQKVQAGQVGGLRALFGANWNPTWEGGSLYVIDLRIFENVAPDTTDLRFTPATVTLLTQDAKTKDLRAVAVRVSGQGGSTPQVYVETSPAWLYGLQAAKASVTVHGIWIGHVYHWHMVTAAMLLAMQRAMPEEDDPATEHPVRQLLAPQSKYLFAFDEVLLLLWSEIAPPTSVETPWDFLRLMSRFATNRSYFMDDPLATLARNGITVGDFTERTPWDKYPIVQTFLEVWQATAAYVAAFVDNTYTPNNPVGADAVLQEWIQQAADSNGGNVSGLPARITTNDELKQVLTSLVYRITMHGSARLLSTANPGLTFVANFPPCLQILTIPVPSTPLAPKELLEYMPRTGTIGGMVKFYYTFSFSRPYEPFVPKYGLDSNLFFGGGATAPCNQALIGYRQAIQTLIDRLSPISPPNQSQRYQWPLSIET